MKGNSTPHWKAALEKGLLNLLIDKLIEQHSKVTSKVICENLNSSNDLTSIKYLYIQMELREIWSCCQCKSSSYAELAEHAQKMHIKFRVIVRKPNEWHVSNKRTWKFCCTTCNWKYRIFDDVIMHFITNHMIHSKSDRRFDEQNLSKQLEDKGYQSDMGMERSNPPTTSICSTFNELESSSATNESSLNGHLNLINGYEFKAMNTKEKTEALRRFGLCFKCLKKHPRNKCSKEKCQFCGGPHHIILCYKKENWERAAICLLNQDGKSERTMSSNKISN